MAPCKGGDRIPSAEETKVAPDLCGGHPKLGGAHTFLTAVETGVAAEDYSKITGSTYDLESLDV